MTPKQADALVHEFTECMIKQTVRDRTQYGPNLYWSTRKELQKAFCLHVAGLHLSGIDLISRNEPVSSSVAFESYYSSLSYRELLEDAFRRVFNFRELGAPSWDIVLDKSNEEFSLFIDALLNEDRLQDSFWERVTYLLKKITSFSLSSEGWTAE